MNNVVNVARTSCLIAMLGAMVATAACNLEPGWEEFRDDHVAAYHNGEPVYILEGDMIISEERLHAFYDVHLAGPKAGVGSTSQASIVDRHNGADAIWSRTMALNLTWCISPDIVDDGIDSERDRIHAAMTEATRDWEAATFNWWFSTIDFKLVGNCNNAVVKIVRWPTTTNSMSVFGPEPRLNHPLAAPFPADYEGQPMSFFVDIKQVERNGWHLASAFRHEVGHILGLRHEHIRPEAGRGGCSEDWRWRPLTTYDAQSIMSYTNGCSQGPYGPRYLTARDKSGVRTLYGHTGFIVLF